MAKRRAEQLLAKEKQRKAIHAGGMDEERSVEGGKGRGGEEGAVSDLKLGMKAIEI